MAIADMARIPPQMASRLPVGESVDAAISTIDAPWRWAASYGAWRLYVVCWGPKADQAADRQGLLVARKWTMVLRGVLTLESGHHPRKQGQSSSVVAQMNTIIRVRRSTQGCCVDR
jgi:hypothetical protein